VPSSFSVIAQRACSEACSIMDSAVCHCSSGQLLRNEHLGPSYIVQHAYAGVLFDLEFFSLSEAGDIIAALYLQ